MSEDQVSVDLLELIQEEYRKRGLQDALAKRPPRVLEGQYFKGYQEGLEKQGRGDPWPELASLQRSG